MTPSTGRLVSALTIWDTDLTVDALMVPEVDVVCGAEDSEIVAAEAAQASSINNSFNPYNKVTGYLSVCTEGYLIDETTV